MKPVEVGVISDTHGLLRPEALVALAGVDLIVHAGDVVVEVAGASLFVLHDLGRLDLDPRAAGFHAVICGHSHVPQAAVRDGVLYLNPGSAGPRRFRLPVAVARLTVDGARLAARIVTLTPPP